MLYITLVQLLRLHSLDLQQTFALCVNFVSGFCLLGVVSHVVFCSDKFLGLTCHNIVILCSVQIFLPRCKRTSLCCVVDETTLMPEFEEGTSLEEQLRVLLDRLESAQSNYPCKCLATVSCHLGLSQRLMMWSLNNVIADTTFLVCLFQDKHLFILSQVLVA